jgi:death-on-curing protein
MPGEPENDTSDIEYPTVDTVLVLHETIIEGDARSEPGVRNEGDIEYALQHIEHGSFGERPGSLHETAFQLFRLLVSNHPFVDGNKRTALQSTVVLYEQNGHELRYGADMESFVRLLALDERLVRPAPAAEYLSMRAVPTGSTDGGDPGSGMASAGRSEVPPELVEELRDIEHLPRADLRSLREDCGVTFRDLVAVEELRHPVLKAFARADIREHQDIYDRLAES